MRTKTYFIQTFGCAMNEYDSERMAAVIEKRGYIPCESPKNADIIIYNTCSVREKPYSKLFSYLGRAKIFKESNPNIIVGISGCIAQQDGEALIKRWGVVDFVMGTDALSRMDKILDKVFSGQKVVDTDKCNGGFRIEPFKHRTEISANVTIMKGCENFCSYCIVPFVRGKEMSRKPAEIIDEIKYLTDECNIKEICLLGQNVNSYGKDISDNIDFSDLLKMLNNISSLKRIRFLTSHPKDFSEKLVNTMAECDKVCKYIHLPIQSGSDRILEMMNRKYTKKEYLQKIDYARKFIDNIGFSSDFIVGFPGETEDDFNHTLDAVKYVGYNHIFAFNYSPRPGTLASKMEDNIPYETKNKRLNELFELQNKLIDSKLQGYIKSVASVLAKEKTGTNAFIGTDMYNRKVTFTSNTANIGDLVDVCITSAKRSSLSGIDIKDNI